MKIAFFGTNSIQFGKVFSKDILEELSKKYEISERINKKNIETYKGFLSDCEIAFATWGMPKFTEEEIKKYLPNLKALFYAEGTVQYFAKPFLNCAVRIFSAASVNAIPVAEYTFAQIALAAKGYFQSAKRYRLAPLHAFMFSDKSEGNFKAKVGLVGLGAIGSMVAEKLKALDVEVFAYDPFVSPEKAKELNVKLTDLDTLFTTCNVISNHLANKKELENIYNYKLFSKMKKHSTFINTGRGAQVSEYALALSLIMHPSHTAVADVIKSEYFPYISPLFWCYNAILTPHIAGSMGKEPRRMAYYMIEALEKYLNNQSLSCEVTHESLEKMA